MKVQLFALMLAVAAPLSAQASNTNSSFIEFGYGQTGTPLSDIYSFALHDYRGAAIKGQWAFNENWNVSAGYTEGGSGVSVVDLDSAWSLGLGYRHNFSDNMALSVDLNYQSVNESFSSTGIDSDVWGVEVGVTGGNDNWSGSASLGYETWDSNNSFDPLNNDQGFARFTGGYHFNANWSIQAQYKLGFDNSDAAFLGARYTF